mgnify:CR=1 FL=1
MWQQFRDWLNGYEQTAVTLMIGFTSLAMRIYRYRIRNKHIIIENIIYCLLVCIIVVPWLKVVLDLADRTAYIFTYFMCQAAKPIIQHFAEQIKNKFKIND